MPKITVHGPSNAAAAPDEVGFVAPPEPEPEPAAAAETPALPPDAEPEADESAGYAAYRILDLRDLARDRGLAVTGSKAELVQRLTEHDAEQAAL